ncbi:MAG: hypothetical protein HQ541_10245 [Mariniphaga sp.]|nr:hypothetical protein [Mariniphaga sp.]
MKKLILLFVITFASSQMSNAQIYVGIEGSILYPFATLANEVDAGYGPSLSLGYIIKNKVVVSAGYELLFFSTLQQEFRLQSGYVSFKYLIINKKINPYLGFQVGNYQYSKYLTPTLNAKENAFGIRPMAGIKTNSGLTDKLKIDISTSFSKIFFKNNYKFLSLKIGLHYYF